MGRFSNPILPGFHPDPSICRVGSDFYLVTSTFEYFPGLPLYHSRDLVHWRPVGHVLDRPSQLPLDGVRPSGGLYAPTIRHHEGVFYVVCTLVDGTRESGNFVVTATDPGGAWSEPQWLAEADGFDPSLFFDEGRVWWTACRQVVTGYPGQTEIWLRELDPVAMRLVGEERVIWRGATVGAVWAEAPHLYKVDGRYYLVCAEGGTAHHHSVTVARADEVTGPYTGAPHNPVLTHRHLGLDHPIVGVGHADLVRTEDGQWWAVLLGMRPYDGYFHNLGRETFLAPVDWEDGWPLLCRDTGRVEFSHPAPAMAPHPWPAPPACDNFEASTLGPEWSVLRTPREPFWSLTERQGHLRLHLGPRTLAELTTPSFVARRQQHIDFVAHTALDFEPKGEHECAGLALVQNNDFHVRFVVAGGSGRVVRLILRRDGAEETVAEAPVPPGRIYLGVEAHGQSYVARFATAAAPGAWTALTEFDGRLLSTQVAGGFVGACLGMYASSNGEASETIADFDWFDYHGL